MLVHHGHAVLARLADPPPAPSVYLHGWSAVMQCSVAAAARALLTRASASAATLAHPPARLAMGGTACHVVV